MEQKLSDGGNAMKSVRVETPEEFVARGGKITSCKPYVPTRRVHKTCSNQTKLVAAVELLKSGNFYDAIAMAR